MANLPTNALDEFACKDAWKGKPHKALCVQCERVIHAGDSEKHCERKAREHENRMAEYASRDDEHAEVMNPQGVEHEVAVRYDLAALEEGN